MSHSLHLITHMRTWGIPLCPQHMYLGSITLSEVLSWSHLFWNSTPVYTGGHSVLRTTVFRRFWLRWEFFLMLQPHIINNEGNLALRMPPTPTPISLTRAAVPAEKWNIWSSPSVTESQSPVTEGSLLWEWGTSVWIPGKGFCSLMN